MGGGDVFFKVASLHAPQEMCIWRTDENSRMHNTPAFKILISDVCWLQVSSVKLDSLSRGREEFKSEEQKAEH